MSEKIRFTVDGNEYEMSLDEIEKYAAPETEIPKTGYERVEMGVRYYVSEKEEVAYYAEIGDNVDDSAYQRRDYYSDMDLAVNCVRADTLLRKIRRWQAENDDKVDFGDPFTSKWQIVYDSENDDIFVFPVSVAKFLGGIYFTSRSKAIEAADEFKDELKWYFTEYRSRL